MTNAELRFANAEFEIAAAEFGFANAEFLTLCALRITTAFFFSIYIEGIITNRRSPVENGGSDLLLASQ